MGKLLKVLLTVALLSPAAVQSRAQFTAAPSSNGKLRFLSLLKPPVGSKVAIVVFEDLGCPGCAHAHPVEQQVSAATHVPIVRYDFPIASHIWTMQGAVCARYIQDRINPGLADQFRSDVFTAQQSIASRDDIMHYFEAWLSRHGQAVPFELDGDGSLKKAVQADFELGQRINVGFTPTVIVVSNDKEQVVCGKTQTDDINQLAAVVQAAQRATRARRN
jgi:protein-disulfide isomerase